MYRLDRIRVITFISLGLTLMFAFQNCGDNQVKSRAKSKLFQNTSDLSCEQMKYVPVELGLPASIEAGKPFEVRVLNGNMYLTDTMLFQIASKYCDVIEPDASVCSVSVENTSVVIRATINDPGSETIIFSAFDYCRFGRAKIESVCVSGPDNICPVIQDPGASLTGLCEGKKDSMSSCHSGNECCSNNCVESKCMPSSVSVVK